MVSKFGFTIALILLYGTGSSASANVSERPAIIAPKATQSILLDIARAGQRIVIAGDRGHILYSDDEGERWVQASVPSQKMLTAISFVSDQTGYAVGHDAIILKTDDGGSTWQKVYENLELGVPLLDIWFASEGKGIAVGAYGLTVKTDNSGNTWEVISDAIGNADEMHLNVIVGNQKEIVIAGEQGVLFHSNDRGHNWQSINSGYNGSWFGLVQKHDQQLWLSGLRGTVYQSNNRGQEWSAEFTGLTQTLFGATLLNDQYPVLVGDAGTVAIKQNNRWHSKQLDHRKTLNAVLPTQDRHLIVVGEMGVEKVALDTILSGVSP